MIEFSSLCNEVGKLIHWTNGRGHRRLGNAAFVDFLLMLRFQCFINNNLSSSWSLATNKCTGGSISHSKLR